MERLTLSTALILSASETIRAGYLKGEGMLRIIAHLQTHNQLGRNIYENDQMFRT